MPDVEVILGPVVVDGEGVGLVPYCTRASTIVPGEIVVSILRAVTFIPLADVNRREMGSCIPDPEVAWKVHTGYPNPQSCLLTVVHVDTVALSIISIDDVGDDSP